MSKHHVPDAPAHPSDPTTSELPKHRRGGQELPDDVQDRPEQNAGYDAAVHGEPVENTDEEDRDESRDATDSDVEVEREREEDSRNDADVESDEPQHRPH